MSTEEKKNFTSAQPKPFSRSPSTDETERSKRFETVWFGGGQMVLAWVGGGELFFFFYTNTSILKHRPKMYFVKSLKTLKK